MQASVGTVHSCPAKTLINACKGEARAISDFVKVWFAGEEAQKKWEAFRLDPEFQEVIKAEQAEKTLEKADIIWLRPTDFSPMK